MVAINYARATVARAKELLGALADKVRLADFFTHYFGERKFEVVYERTFLCSLPPERWPTRAKRMTELLVHDGKYNIQLT